MTSNAWNLYGDDLIFFVSESVSGEKIATINI